MDEVLNKTENLSAVNNEKDISRNSLLEKKMSTPRWYCLKTEPGKEYIVRDALEKKMNNSVIAESLFAVKIIEDEKVEVKKGKKVRTIVNLYPNHVYIKFKYSKEIWWEIVSTEGAYSFLGPDARPLALRKSEVIKIGLEERPKADISQFNVGDKIKVISGTFKDSESVINSIDPENRKVSVSILLLGTSQDINLDIDTIVKI